MPYNSFLWIKQWWLGSKDQGSKNAPPYILQSKARDQTPVISIVPYCVDDRVSPWPTLTRRAICRVPDGLPGSRIYTEGEPDMIQGEKRRKGPCKHGERTVKSSYSTGLTSVCVLCFIIQNNMGAVSHTTSMVTDRSAFSTWIPCNPYACDYSVLLSSVRFKLGLIHLFVLDH